MPLNNFGIVLKHKSGALLFRAAQPDRIASTVMRELDCDTYIKLNTEQEMRLVDAQMLFSNVIPLDVPILSPDPNKTIAMCKVIDDILAAGDSSLMTCVHGIDRTGYMAAAYMMLYGGRTFDQVMHDRYDYGTCFVRDVVADSRLVYTLESLKHFCGNAAVA